jgi:hypothetical protein
LICFRGKAIDAALKYSLEALNSSRRVFGENSRETERCHHLIMLLFLEMKKVKRASEYFENSLKIRSSSGRDFDISFEPICFNFYKSNKKFINELVKVNTLDVFRVMTDPQKLGLVLDELLKEKISTLMDE